MTTLHVTWRIEPATPPRPHRHCSSCKTTRPFLPSGKIRLNANGNRLDAWLIYRCAICEATWNLPLLDRISVARVPAATLEALHRSDAAFVRACAFDLTLLRRHASRIDAASRRFVHRSHSGPRPADWTAACLALHATSPTDRLDRLLSQELDLSRAAVLQLHASGALRLDDKAALRKPVPGRADLNFTADGLAPSLRATLLAGLIGKPPDTPTPD